MAKCLSPLRVHVPSNFLLEKPILHCHYRIPCCTAAIEPEPGCLEIEAAICIPPLMQRARPPHAGLKHEWCVLDSCLVFSGLCSLHFWPGTKAFWIYAISALCKIHSQWGWKCLERTSSPFQPLTHQEWQRWQEAAPPPLDLCTSQSPFLRGTWLILHWSSHGSGFVFFDLQGLNVFENITLIKLAGKSGSRLEGANREIIYALFIHGTRLKKTPQIQIQRPLSALEGCFACHPQYSQLVLSPSCSHKCTRHQDSPSTVSQH